MRTVVPTGSVAPVVGVALISSEGVGRAGDAVRAVAGAAVRAADGFNLGESCELCVAWARATAATIARITAIHAAFFIATPSSPADAAGQTG